MAPALILSVQWRCVLMLDVACFSAVCVCVSMAVLPSCLRVCCVSTPTGRVFHLFSSARVLLPLVEVAVPLRGGCVESLLVVMIDQRCVLLNWNVRGLNSPARRKVVRDLARDTACTIACLQETKMQAIDDAIVCESLGPSFRASHVFLPASGTRGGALLAVHEDYYRILQTEVRGHSVSAKLQPTTGVGEWWLTVVYGPQEDGEKIQFLQKPRDLRQFLSDRWLVIGDFNLILQAQDKSNSNLNRRMMGTFRSWVNDLELKELSLQGRRFTWSNDVTQTRIDRAFCTSDWDLMLPGCALQALSSSVSDHCPLLLVGRREIAKYSGFRFEVFWPKVAGYSEVVQTAWGQELTVVNPFLRLHTKLQRTGKALRNWARSKIGHVKLLLCAAKQLIGILDVVQDFRQLTEQEIQLKRDLKARVLGLSTVEKIRAKQQSRLTAIKAENANSRMFFMRINGRKRKNFIQQLHTDSEAVFGHKEKEEIIFRHFSK